MRSCLPPLRGPGLKTTVPIAETDGEPIYSIGFHSQGFREGTNDPDNKNEKKTPKGP